MKLPQMILLFGGLGLAGCAHTSSPQQSRSAAAPTTTAPLSSSTPVALRTPRSAPDETALTPANGVGSARPTTGASLVSTQATAPAPNSTATHDQAGGAQDWQSIQEIRQALAADPRLAAAASQISINVQDGRVLLRGQVTTADQRALIEKAARQAGGVIDVRNMLQVME
jgi:osmotically-inducible protein OsmY